MINKRRLLFRMFLNNRGSQQLRCSISKISSFKESLSKNECRVRYNYIIFQRNIVSDLNFKQKISPISQNLPSSNEDSPKSLHNFMELSFFLDVLCGTRSTQAASDVVSRRFETNLQNKLTVQELFNRLDLSADGVASTIQCFDEKLPNMDIEQSNVRHTELLQRLSNEILKHPKTLSMIQLSKLSSAIGKLTFKDPHLLGNVKRDFLQILRTSKATDWHSIVTIVTSFGKLRIGDEEFWTDVLFWMAKNYQPRFVEQATFALYACASVNVPSNLVKPLAVKALKSLDIKSFHNPRNWLNVVHTFAIFNLLTQELAETALNTEFLNAIKDEQKAKKLMRNTVYYDTLRLINIANAARHDLGLDLHRGPLPSLRQISDEMSSVVRRLKYSEASPPELERFLAMLSLIVPQGSLCSTPEWYENIAVVESRLWIDPVRREFVNAPQSNNDLSPNMQEVVVLYYLDQHLTWNTPLSESPIRLEGIYQMQLRHLHHSGKQVRPIVIAERDLALLEPQERMNYVRGEILRLSEKYIKNDWTSTKQME